MKTAQSVTDPHYIKTPSSLVRTDDYKLINFYGDYLHESDYKTVIPGEHYELYRINEDISGQENLANAMPEGKFWLFTSISRYS